MTPRARVLAALDHRPTDCTPRFEVWIDAFVDTFALPDTAAAHVAFGQDSVLLPGRPLPGSAAWRTGIDEFGRVWRDGQYVDGVIATAADLVRYSPAPALATTAFDAAAVAAVRRRYPDHCHFFGTHVGPFQAAYLAMGMARFMLCLVDAPSFVAALLEARTTWAIALFQAAVKLGAEVIVMGDDAGYRGGPLISPAMWRRFVLPCHQRIVAALPVPVIWHSDGDITALLPLAIEAGFAGIHGLEPGAGVDLAAVKARYGAQLALLGNVDVTVLCGDDPATVRREVARSLAQGAAGGGFLLSTCNSIFPGMNPRLVCAYFAAAAALVAAPGKETDAWTCS